MKHSILHPLDELGDIRQSRRARIRATKVVIDITTEVTITPSKRNLAKEEYYNTRRAIKLYLDDDGKYKFKTYSWDFDTYKTFCALDKFCQMRWISINDAKALVSRWNRAMSKHYLFK